MKLLSLLPLLALLSPQVSALSLRDETIQRVNAVQSSWEAGINDKFLDDHDFSFAKRLCGSLKSPPEKRLPLKVHEITEELPKAFDARDQWPECATIREVRDQSDCGSCWAFAASEAASDRVCIETGKYAHLSTTDLLSCCSWCGSGCDGGYPPMAWSWLTSSGIVTGGNYDDFDYCVSYPFPECNHHVKGVYQNCSDLNGGNEYATPSCASSCDAKSKYKTPYAKDKHFFASSYSISSNQTQIMAEILKHGPVEAAFTVYADFPNYKKGVYKYTTGEELGGHAVKILGWGVEDGQDYWLVANSWNYDWGLRGFFKIARGIDECGIEDEIVAGLYKK